MTTAAALSPPLAALLELTHRCPLQCPYCSNPLELERAKGDMFLRRPVLKWFDWPLLLARAL